MIATVARTARELYDCDSTMRAFVAEWDRERRCSLIFVEYLTDQELYGPAACALWAATEPDRPNYFDESHKHGPHPVHCRSEWVWNDRLNGFAHSLPGVQEECARVKSYGSQHRFKDSTDAILCLLDNWKPTA